MTKMKKSAPSANDVGAAISTAPIVPSKVTPKAENSKRSKVLPTKANAASLTVSHVKPPRVTLATKASGSDAKNHTAVATKRDAPGPAKPAEAEPAKVRTTKQEQVLTMLSESGGVTIDEMMVVTGWQQHSVRGFLAGTVRKKLGLDIASVKAAGSERRYAIKVAS